MDMMSIAPIVAGSRCAVLLLLLTVQSASAHPGHSTARHGHVMPTHSACSAAMTGFILTPHLKDLHRLDANRRYAPVGQAMFYPNGQRCGGRHARHWRG
ncbi:hypothetical protein AA103193_1310 [Tanticharoenia sakaeratensis NBRC 103193]|nr:hypothetical protein AA103193_1310 [Tanticharoenia sakaeratensis NBRC 103193]